MPDQIVASKDGTNLAVRDHGGHGPDVLFLHGRSRSLVDWGPVVAHLDNLRAVAMDLRWHGRSGVGGLVTMEVLLDDIDAVTRSLNLRHPCLVGHSLGGIIATYHVSARSTCSGAINIDGLDTGMVDLADGEKLEAATGPRRRRGPDHGDGAWHQSEIARLRRAEDEFGVPAEVVEAFIERAFLRDQHGTWHRRPPNAFYDLPLGRDAEGYISVLERTLVPVMILLCSGPVKTPSYRDRPMTITREAMLRTLRPLQMDKPNIQVRTIDGSHAVIWEKPGDIAGLVASMAMTGP